VKSSRPLPLLICILLCILIFRVVFPLVNYNYRDDLIAIEAAFRICQGQVPILDYTTFLGPLSHYIPSIFACFLHGYGLNIYKALPLTDLFISALCIYLAFLITRGSSRQSFDFIILSILIVGTATLPRNYSPFQLGFAFSYNRWGLEILAIYLYGLSSAFQDSLCGISRRMQTYAALFLCLVTLVLFKYTFVFFAIPALAIFYVYLIRSNRAKSLVYHLFTTHRRGQLWFYFVLFFITVLISIAVYIFLTDLPTHSFLDYKGTDPDTTFNTAKQAPNSLPYNLLTELRTVKSLRSYYEPHLAILFNKRSILVSAPILVTLTTILFRARSSTNRSIHLAFYFILTSFSISLFASSTGDILTFGIIIPSLLPFIRNNQLDEKILTSVSLLMYALPSFVTFLYSLIIVFSKSFTVIPLSRTLSIYQSNRLGSIEIRDSPQVLTDDIIQSSDLWENHLRNRSSNYVFVLGTSNILYLLEKSQPGSRLLYWHYAASFRTDNSNCNGVSNIYNLTNLKRGSIVIIPTHDFVGLTDSSSRVAFLNIIKCNKKVFTPISAPTNLFKAYMINNYSSVTNSHIGQIKANQLLVR
jgi:hypothetical protein